MAATLYFRKAHLSAYLFLAVHGIIQGNYGLWSSYLETKFPCGRSLRWSSSLALYCRVTKVRVVINQLKLLTFSVQLGIEMASLKVGVSRFEIKRRWVSLMMAQVVLLVVVLLIGVPWVQVE